MDKGKDNVLNIIAIVVTVISILITIVNPFDKFDTNIRLIVGGIYIIVILVLGFYYRLSKLEKLIEENLDNRDFQNYWEEDIYIPMDIIDGTGKRIPLFSQLMSIIKEKHAETKYICILGDTGSGKTDALVHFLEEYVNHFRYRLSMPSPIRLFTMNVGYAELKKNIQEEYPTKKERKKCILLLDALDECKEARESLVNTPDNNPSLFMKTLADDAKDFAKVIVTCRKQFFMREEYLPDGTPVKMGKPQGPDPFLRWQKLYIAPFSDKQVDAYLLRKFGIAYGEETCNEANRIVSSCKDVFLRPLILSYIDIVMEVYAQRQEPLSMKDIYDAIVFYWIQRDADNNQKEIERLLNVSIATAGYMYKNNLNCLNDEYYREFCREYKIDDRDNLIRVKSLLTNDKEGYRFPHKSFYDYLLAYWLFLNPWDIDSVLGLDFTLEIYQGIYEAYKSQGESSGIEQCLKVRNVPNDTVAAGLHNLAYELYNLYHFNSAEPLCREALVIRRQLSEKDPNAYLPKVADTLNHLGALHYYIQHHKEAEAEFQEALDTYRQLANKNPDAFMPNVATTLRNLAILHGRINHPEMAEAELQETLIYFRTLAEKDSDNFKKYVAWTLNNIAALHRDANRYDEAEAEYQEALTICRQLADKNPDAFQMDVAQTQNNLANLHSKINRYKEAEAEFQEALTIRRQLAEKNKTPDAFLPNVAGTLYGFAGLHLKQNNLTEAETMAQECLEIYQRMSEISHEAFDKNVKKASKLLNKIRKKQAPSSDIQESTES